jgi:DNA-binding response OmpR family regulator
MHEVRDRRLRILIVEDEALLALFLQECIEDIGHEVVGTAASSQEALALAREHKPNLAYVDIQLNDGPTGVDTARKLSENDETIAIFMTANQKLIPGDFAGAAGVVVKPYTSSGVLAALRFINYCVSAKMAKGRPPASLRLSKTFAERWKVPA